LNRFLFMVVSFCIISFSILILLFVAVRILGQDCLNEQVNSERA
jgi:hypothetical protein